MRAADIGEAAGGEGTTAAPGPFAPDLLAGARAIVTGGGTGLGRAVALRLAAVGADVGLLARRPEPLEHTAAELAAAGRRAYWATANIREEDALGDAIGRLVDDLGGVDILINNAGGQFPAVARDISAKGWRSVVDLNLTGTFLVTQAVERHMTSGAVVNVMSNQIDRGGPGVAHSAAARAGVANLTRTLAVEWAPQIRVNAVAPGFFPTQGAQAEMLDNKAVFEALLSAIPAQRYGVAEELADPIVFLVSPAASYITGAVLYVDGGNVLDRGLLTLAPFWNGKDDAQ